MNEQTKLYLILNLAFVMFVALILIVAQALTEPEHNTNADLLASTLSELNMIMALDSPTVERINRVLIKSGYSHLIRVEIREEE